MHFLSPVIFVLVDLTLNKTRCIFSSSTELCTMCFLYKQGLAVQCHLNHTFTSEIWKTFQCPELEKFRFQCN